jgi:glycosyltransferase involved in cell wall biosynthesis
VVVCKEEDRQFFGRSAANVTVVPNGISALPVAAADREHDDRLLFIAKLEYEANFDAEIYLRDMVLPSIRQQRPGAHLVVVGRAGAADIERLHDGVSCLLTGSVADITPYVEQCAVVVVPMRLGGGTRLKLLDALGRGKAVVSTSVGAEGLDLRSEVDLLIADDSGDFADACLRLLKDEDLRRRLGTSGRRQILERYQWSAIAGRVEETLAAVSRSATNLTWTEC